MSIYMNIKPVRAHWFLERDFPQMSFICGSGNFRSDEPEARGQGAWSGDCEIQGWAPGRQLQTGTGAGEAGEAQPMIRNSVDPGLVDI